MLKNLTFILFLFTVTLSFSQSKEELEIKKSYWGNNDMQKKNTDIPDKWKNESAVILYQEYFYDYHKFAKNVKYTYGIRKRVKLLDKASVEEYSEFSFVKKFRVRRGYFGRKAKRFLGMKIIKPDGTEKEIEIDKEAIETDNKEEYKLAISGLEVGDIIDYYSHTIEPFKQKYGYSFRAITKTLNDEYPTKEFVLRFNTENDFFVNFNSYNNAPKLKEIKTEKSNDRRYVLKATDIEKNDFPAWYYPNSNLPYFKFQVIFARSGKFEDKIFNFLSEKEETIKESVSAEDVLELYKDQFGRFKHELKPLKKHFKNTNYSKDKLVRIAYYYMRHYYRNQFIQPSIMRESEIDYGAFNYYLKVNHYFMGDKNRQFISRFANFLIDYKIPFDIVVSKTRSRGDIKSLLFSSEINTLLKINLEKPIYLSVFGDHSTLTSMSPFLENAKAYAISYSYDEKELNSIKEITIPLSSHKDNISIEESTVSITDDFNAIKMNRKSTYKGHSKTSTQEDMLYFFDYLNEDYKRHKSMSYFDRVKNKKNKAKYKKEYEALVKKLQKSQQEKALDVLKNEYDLAIEDHTFSIENTGRFEDTPDFITNQEFTITEDLIKKAGPNYIVEIGKLIGTQVNFSGDERIRKEDIHLNYPKSFKNTLRVTIPEGYTISGLDNLTKNVTNDTGSFVSSAEIEDGILVISTLKEYKGVQFSNSKWSSILSFIDAADQFTNEKILLKKQ